MSEIKIKGIDGLTVEDVGPCKRVVRYNGQVCQLICRTEDLCEENTSYRGCILDSCETYQTPIGVARRTYWARGPGLERSGIRWELVPVKEVSAAQERFLAASREIESARAELEALTPK